MAKFSMKQGGKEVGPASVYAKPHTMSGKPVSVATVSKVMQDPNKLAADKMTNRTATPRVSMGDPAADDVKTSGIKIRGTGAATKGITARGPMA
jgi:hypothetical protein